MPKLPGMRFPLFVPKTPGSTDRLRKEIRTHVSESGRQAHWGSMAGSGRDELHI